MDGTTFLALYGVLFLLALATAWKVRRHLRIPDDDVRDGELHPYLHAYLLGGEARALASCIAALQERNVIVLRKGDGASTIATTTHGAVADTLTDPLERALVRAIEGGGPVSLDAAFARQLRALPELAVIREQLERRALLLDETAAWPARFAPAAIMFAFAAVGGARIMHGINNGKPVGFVLMMACVAVSIAAYYAANRVIRSVRGDLVLARINASFRERRDTQTHRATHEARVEHVARAVAIEGPSAVPSLAAVLGVLMVGTGFNVDGSGGDGGGGDGGGGCGGCGGCGG